MQTYPGITDGFARQTEYRQRRFEEIATASERSIGILPAPSVMVRR